MIAFHNSTFFTLQIFVIDYKVNLKKTNFRSTFFDFANILVTCSLVYLSITTVLFVSEESRVTIIMLEL